MVMKKGLRLARTGYNEVLPHHLSFASQLISHPIVLHFPKLACNLRLPFFSLTIYAGYHIYHRKRPRLVFRIFKGSVSRPPCGEGLFFTNANVFKAPTN